MEKVILKFVIYQKNGLCNEKQETRKKKSNK